MAQKQPTAIKALVKEVTEGNWVERGGTDPSIVQLTDGTEVARLQLVGIIVDQSEGSPPHLIFDDGTGRIAVRAFEKVPGLNTVKIGSPVRIIARPRKYGEELFVVPECIRVLEDIKWIEVHKQEVKSRVPKQNLEVPQTPQPSTNNVPFVEEEVISKSPLNSIIDTIRTLDSGTGAEAEEVLAKTKCSDDDLQKLLARGEIFQVSPGFLKVLE